MKKFDVSKSHENSTDIKFAEKLSHSDMGIAISEKNISLGSKCRDDDWLIRHAQNIESILREARREQDEDRHREEQELKFQFAAIVLDRFFFYLALIYAIITFAGLVLTIPNLYKF